MKGDLDVMGSTSDWVLEAKAPNKQFSGFNQLRWIRCSAAPDASARKGQVQPPWSIGDLVEELGKGQLIPIVVCIRFTEL